MKRKELRKLLSHFFKVNQQLTAPGQKQLTVLQAKLHYLKIISELPSYGAKCFSTNFKVGQMNRNEFLQMLISSCLLLKPDTSVETVILVSPKYGVSQISGLRDGTVSKVWYLYCFSSSCLRQLLKRDLEIVGRRDNIQMEIRKKLFSTSFVRLLLFSLSLVYVEKTS